MENFLLILIFILLSLSLAVVAFFYFKVKYLKEKLETSSASNTQFDKQVLNSRLPNDAFVVRKKRWGLRRQMDSEPKTESVVIPKETTERLQHKDVLETIEINTNDSLKEIEEKEKYIFKNKLTRINSNFSDREMDICFYISKSLNARQIAEILHMNQGTIRVTKNKIRLKLGLASNTEIKPFLLGKVKR